MSAKPSRLVLKDQRKAEKVAGAIDAVDLNAVASGLDTFYGSVLREGEVMPQWSFALELDQRIVREISGAIGKSDKARSADVAGRSLLRKGRDYRGSVLRSHVRSIGDRVGIAYGSDVKRAFGFFGTLATESAACMAEAEAIQERLRDPMFAFPTPKPGALPLDAVALADELDAPIQNMKDGIQEHAQQREKAVTSLIAKSGDREEKHSRYVHVTRHVEDSLRMAGFGEEADRLRLTLRRSGSAEDPDGGDGVVPDGGDGVVPDGGDGVDDGVAAPDGGVAAPDGDE